jgi:hypothetical protein
MFDFFKTDEIETQTLKTKLSHVIGNYGHIVGETLYLFFTAFEGHGGHAIAAGAFLVITLYNAFVNGDVA